MDAGGGFVGDDTETGDVCGVEFRDLLDGLHECQRRGFATLERYHGPLRPL